MSAESSRSEPSKAAGDRSRYWPIIEKRYGKPMSHWHKEMKKVAGKKYPEQMAFLQEEHGFARVHANALVQYSRGSMSSRKFETLDEFLADHEAVKQKTVRSILRAITTAFPDAEVVIAWNQPMVRRADNYVFGLSVARSHILIAPFDPEVIEDFRDQLAGYKVNKKTIQVPVDWKVDKELLRDMVAAASDR